MGVEQIRNFSIIAHIDHGKTTLSDRFLELTHAVAERDMVAQVLDDMDLERERGITIKARSVALRYRSRAGGEYLFNLIDTPGHVDFSYEVSRSLQACEGAVLVVDATQGVEAQTLANAHQAIAANLAIVPVVNKIDMPLAEPERTMDQLEDLLAIDRRECLLVSAKAGIGVDALLEAVVERIPNPRGNPSGPLRALVFDSWYDSYRGVIVLLRVVDGAVEKGMRVRFLSTRADYDVEEVGIYAPRQTPTSRLGQGEVGYLICNIKRIGETRIGDTVTDARQPASVPLPGFQAVKPMVFAGLYPAAAEDYEDLRDAIEKLVLNDSSLQFQPETSAALGFGFRCGFLGLLHMEIVQERLEREYDLHLITTAPTVKYRVLRSSGDIVEVESPKDLPPPQEIESIEEPWIEVTILTRDDYVGPILKLLEEKRSLQRKFEYIGTGRVMLVYDMPLNEMVLDFHDRLKSVSKGYASMDYSFLGHREGDLVKMDILVNGEPVDALSLIVPQERAYTRGKSLVTKMKEVIPRQLFEVAIQAAVGSRVIARETVRPLRKNVLAKCYGGDITRKRKLLEKQKEGKRRMKKVGRVEIPQEAFLALLKVEEH